jgi:hypothetical protein
VPPARTPRASLGFPTRVVGDDGPAVAKKKIAERDEDVARRAERLLLGAARARPRETRTRGGEDARKLLGIHALVFVFVFVFISVMSRYVTIRNVVAAFAFEYPPERVQRGSSRVALAVQALAGDDDATRQRRGKQLLVLFLVFSRTNNANNALRWFLQWFVRFEIQA